MFILMLVYFQVKIVGLPNAFDINSILNFSLEPASILFWYALIGDARFSGFETMEELFLGGVLGGSDIGSEWSKMIDTQGNSENVFFR